jgi:predicted nucleotidyltransferase component of viral defense system
MNSGLIGPQDEPLLNLNELISIANRDGVDLATVERDYAMTHIMTSLANQPISEALEFKGGTSLRLCHFPDYRDSTDIDLNLIGDWPVCAARLIRRRMRDLPPARHLSNGHRRVCRHPSIWRGINI